MSRMGKEFWGLAKRIAMMVEKLIFGAGGSKVRRGRPRKYENWEVILALMVKDREGLPYRKVEWRLRELGERAMDYTTICYRVKRMGADGEGMEFLIRLIGLEVDKMMRILKAKEFWLFIHLFRTKKINFFNTLKNQLKNLIIYKLSIFLAIFMR